MADLKPQTMAGGVCTVAVASPAHLYFFQQRCTQPFTQAAQMVTGNLVTVSFVADRTFSGGVYGDTDGPLPISPDNTFEEFVTGPCNRLSHAAAMAVADRPGKVYNPLFIHGGVGLGKTHLLQAICQRMLDQRPDERIVYMSCDSFVNQFIQMVGSGQMRDFRNRFRNVDVIVIDDIHFLQGKTSTQEEFFHTFNTLHQQQKQIILSADCPPKEIPELEERLISRFNWGLVAQIDKPCYETRVAILQRKSAARGISIPDEVMAYVAQRIENNTRELEGAITKLAGMAQVYGRLIDMDMVRAALGEAPQIVARRISIQQILDAVTSFYQVRLADVQGERKQRHFVRPRQVCMHLARLYTNYSLQEIGDFFGGRDHTTVLHAERKVKELMQNDREFAGQVQHLEQQLKSL